MACQAVAHKASFGNTSQLLRLAMKNKTIDQVRADLARNLKSIRLSKGLAQERLALEADVDRTVVSKIERAVTNPSLDVLLRLANMLDVQLIDLLASNAD